MKRILVSILLMLPFTVWAQTFLPLSTGETVKHTYYTLSYNESKEQANWVYYELTAADVSGKESRTDDFRPDPEVKTGSASLADYSGSGYDRGHLCPAAAMRLNHKAMSETFYLSNMSPQKPSFNRGIWKKLEAQVRNWALMDGDIYVVSGPIFKNDLGFIGPDRITVPGFYYKVVYDPHGKQKMIAFILPNETGTKPLPEYVVSVDMVEAMTGIDFFPELPDSIENKLEAAVNPGAWSFTSAATSTYSSSAHHSSKNGITKATTSRQCQAITKSGKRCSRKAEPGSKYCWQHQKK
ncbi:DNA/RNA non-specific endonuclease [Prolixibacter denitrificans]|nr:DNA/RNA non-specific endonuclease [Prolixibacter denitrificans]PSK80376.1 endonuclease G [Prolixibacter denitrificans]